jgi:hypothetical protein
LDSTARETIVACPTITSCCALRPPPPPPPLLLPPLLLLQLLLLMLLLMLLVLVLVLVLHPNSAPNTTGIPSGSNRHSYCSRCVSSLTSFLQPLR